MLMLHSQDCIYIRNQVKILEPITCINLKPLIVYLIKQNPFLYAIYRQVSEFLIMRQQHWLILRRFLILLLMPIIKIQDFLFKNHQERFHKFQEHLRLQSFGRKDPSRLRRSLMDQLSTSSVQVHVMNSLFELPEHGLLDLLYLLRLF